MAQGADTIIHGDNLYVYDGLPWYKGTCFRLFEQLLSLFLGIACINIAKTLRYLNNNR